MQDGSQPKFSRLLDISRTISRVGRGPDTGIDRVELAYIKACLANEKPTVFITRLSNQYALLDTDSVSKILKIRDDPELWPRPRVPDAFRLKLSYPQRAALSWVRKNAIWVTTQSDLGENLQGCLEDGFEYLNVGHSNLSAAFLSEVKASRCGALRVLVHDMIPLDHPEFTREGTTHKFSRRMQAVARFADEVICSSNFAMQRIKSYFDDWNTDIAYVLAPLGVEPASRDPVSLAEDHAPESYFVVLGTIEPRKNHLLLLRVWQRMFEENQGVFTGLPKLYIIGNRGWNNEEVFEFITSSPLMNTLIFEENNLKDVDLHQLLLGARALLFPSFAEGYGLPAIEAAQIGLPVVCSDLQVFHELLGAYPRYLDPKDTDAWAAEIGKLTANTSEVSINTRNYGQMSIPTWHSHFATVL